MDATESTKKIIIIGGGVAGLSAGIHGQKNGFETVIYEKNPWVGGSCSAWRRNGFTIDNCLHWLTGTKEGTPTRKMWIDLGVLSDSVPLVKRDIFLASRVGNQCAVLRRDLERTRRELLELSPEDKVIINAFLDCVLLINKLLNSNMNPKDVLHALIEHDFSESHFEFAVQFIKYLNLNSEQIAKEFKNPAVGALFLDFMNKNYESYWLMLAYGFFIDGNGDLPKDGSLGMAKSLREKYLELGGKIILNQAASQISIDKKKRIEKIADLVTIGQEIKKGESYKKIVRRHANGVLFENGEIKNADYIIAACDVNYAYQNLLGNKYTPRPLRKLLKKHGKGKPVIYSSFQVAFAVDGLFECVEDTLGIECATLKIGTQLCSRFTIKNYRLYGDYIAPEGKTVIQVSIPQYAKDYKYWKNLNRADYERAKKDTAEIIMKEIEKTFPEYKFRLSLLDAWTPYSYKKLNNDYLGAYMRYITTPFNLNAFMPLEVKGLDNVFLASHCLRYPGGLPTAAQTGIDCIEEIKKMENARPPFPFLFNT